MIKLAISLELTSKTEGQVPSLTRSGVSSIKPLNFCSVFSQLVHSHFLYCFRYVYIQTVPKDEQSQLGSLTQIFKLKRLFLFTRSQHFCGKQRDADGTISYHVSIFLSFLHCLSLYALSLFSIILSLHMSLGTAIPINNQLWTVGGSNVQGKIKKLQFWTWGFVLWLICYLLWSWTNQWTP